MCLTRMDINNNQQRKYFEKIITLYDDVTDRGINRETEIFLDAEKD